MGYPRYFALCGTFALLLPGTPVFAADLAEAPVVEAPAPVLSGGGLYLRGDIGYKLWSDPNVFFHNGITDETYGFKTTSLGDTGDVGLGIGYQLNERFRTDFTLDYEWDAEFEGRVGCFGCRYKDDRANVDALTLMANGYFDLGNFGGLTPYVGAGIGATLLGFNDFTSTCAIICGKTSFGSQSNWLFSWALMAGASYDINPSWKIDAGYRLLSVNNGDVFDVGFGEVIFKDLYAHEFRVGLRYMIN